MPPNIYNRSDTTNASETYYITVNKQTGKVTFMLLPIGSNPNQPKKRNKKTPGKNQKPKKTANN